MTKKILLLLFILSVAIYAFSTELDGSYKNKNDSICFTDNKLVFSLSGYGALTTNIVGEGVYEINDKYLIINTGKYSGNKSSIESTPTESRDTLSINVIGNKGNFPLSGVLVEFLSASNKVIDRSISDDMGKINNPYNEKVDNIRLSLMGYNGVFLKYDPSLDYTIKLVENKVIEDQAVLFEIKIEDEDSITLTLLSENFNAGSNLDKSLDRASKRAQKINSLGKRFKKEYVSVFYNK